MTRDEFKKLLKGTPAWRVDILESERGWGSKIDESLYFVSKDDAVAFVKHYNKDNNEPVTPDWYMAALEPYSVDEKKLPAQLTYSPRIKGYVTP